MIHSHCITNVKLPNHTRTLVWTLCGSARTPDDVRVTDKTRHVVGVTCPICTNAMRARRDLDETVREHRRAQASARV